MFPDNLFYLKKGISGCPLSISNNYYLNSLTQYKAFSVGLDVFPSNELSKLVKTCNADGLMIVKQGYANVSGAASVSTSPRQETGRCQRRRNKLITVLVWGLLLEMSN